MNGNGRRFITPSSTPSPEHYANTRTFSCAMRNNRSMLHEYHTPVCELSIDTEGGRVHSYSTAHGSLLYASPDMQARDKHAGIPICAPWFGSGQIGSQHPSTHGLVKWVPWDIVHEHVGDEIELILEPHHEQIPQLPGYEGYEGLHYRLHVHAGRTLKLDLHISAEKETVVDAAFHTYLAGQLPATVRLAPSLERNYVADTEGTFSGERRVDSAHDSVFLGGATQPIRVNTGTHQLLLISNQPDAVVWNPGVEDQRFTGDQWKDFLCVETGAVQDHAATIPAGGEWVMSLELAVDE